MRELPLNITFDKGLRPDFRSARNSDFLLDCFNAKITPYGLVPYEPVELPFSQLTLNANQIVLGWPFPQLFKGSSKMLIADRNRIFLVNENDWSVFRLTNFFSALTPTSVVTNITIGNQWQFCEFWDTWMLTNGVNTIFHYNKHLMRVLSPDNPADRMYIGTKPRTQACCAYRGRAWFGGFDPNFFWSAKWTSLVTTFANTTANLATDLAILDSFQGLDENFVWWSSIGGGDMFMLFVALTELEEGFTAGGYDSANSYIIEKMKENTFGCQPMKWKGKVRQMKPLGAGVMVYGDGGVSALIPTDSRMSTKEFTQLASGVSNTGAVGGNEEEHLFVNNDGYLWHVDKEFKVTELGYREYMQSMLGRDIIISYNPQQGGEFYICDGKKSFILTKSGLTEHGQHVTSIINTQGRVYGLGLHKEAMNKEFRLKTDTIGQRQQSGVKHITWMDIVHEMPEFPAAGGTSQSSLKASIDFKYKTGVAFTETDKIELNDEGQAYMGISGKDFRLRLTGTDYRDVNIDSIRARYHVEDRRFVRGPSVNQGDKL